MNELVKVEIPVSPRLAELLRDPNRAAAAGRLVEDMFREERMEKDPLRAAIAALKAEARANGLTDEMIDAELEAYNAERRL